MGVVSARLDEEDERILRQAGINMSELFRNAAHAEARRIVRKQALQTLDRLAVPTDSRSEALLRKDRDAH